MVCEPVLLAALREKRVAGAGLDVFEQEPPGSNPLFQFDNVVLTPHAAGGDLRSRDDMAAAAARAIVALSRGEWPAEQIVNPEVRAKFKWRSEEHTSELQSRGHLVCRLLLEKKNIT